MIGTLSAKGQLVIPSAIRKRHRLAPKSKVDILDLEYAIMIRPLPKGDAFLAARGVLKGKFSTAEFLKMRREERDREERDFRQPSG